MSLGNLQQNCCDWIESTFGRESLLSVPNRAARVLEEMVELAQAEDLPKELVLKIVERAYSRPKGDREQEVAGVMFTLLAYCRAALVDPVAECYKEVRRVTAMSPGPFRAKHREKFEAGTDLIAPT